MYHTNPPDSFHPYNSPDNIEKFIKYYRALDLSTVSFSALANIFNSFIKSVPVIQTKFKAGHYLARARTKKDDVPYNRLSKITLRDADKVQSFGRAHIPHQATFYCSTNHEVAIKEATQWHVTDFNILLSRKMLGSYNPWTAYVTVSIWKVVEDLNLASLVMNKDAAEKNPTVKYFYDSVISDQPTDLFNKNVLKSMNMLLEFFSDEFAKKTIKNESDYFISAYYASEIHKASKSVGKIDGVAYPTVALDYEGENFAITKEAYEKKIKFITAYHAIVFNKEFEEQKMMIGELYKLEEIKGDILIWRDTSTNKVLPIDDSE